MLLSPPDPVQNLHPGSGQGPCILRGRGGGATPRRGHDVRGVSPDADPLLFRNAPFRGDRVRVRSADTPLTRRGVCTGPAAELLHKRSVFVVRLICLCLIHERDYLYARRSEGGGPEKMINDEERRLRWRQKAGVRVVLAFLEQCRQTPSVTRPDRTCSNLDVRLLCWVLHATSAPAASNA